MTQVEELRQQANEISELITKRLITAYSQINALVRSTIGDDYYVSVEDANTNVMMICSNKHNKVYVCIQHGFEYDFHKDEKVFVFNIRANADNIDLLNETSESYTYFAIISAFVSNRNFRESVKNILYNLAIENKDTEAVLFETNKAIEKIALEKERQRSKERAEQKYEEDCAHLYTASANDLALIKKGCGGRFIYRGHPVQIIEFSNNYVTLSAKMQRYSSVYMPKGVKYAIVSSSKIKPE